MEKNRKKEMEKKLEKQSWILSAGNHDPASRHHIWQALFKSKVWYQTVLISAINKDIEKWALGYLYRSLK